MIYCWNCGRKNKSTDEACYKCGEELYTGIKEEEEKPKSKFGFVKKFFILLVFIVIIFLAANWFLNKPVQNNPENTVQGYIQTLETKNFKKILLYIHRDDWGKAQEDIKNWKNVQEVKFSDLEIEIISEEDDNAKVQARGRIESEISGFKKENRFDKKIDLIKKEGRWYLKSIPDFS